MREATFDTIETALAAIADGGIVVVADDEDRENEGDLIMAAECVTAESLAFFVRHTSGLICVAVTGERCVELQLPQMVPPSGNTEQHGTAFTCSVDLRHGTTTGISAADRAATIRALANPATRPEDLNRPGHVFPLRARPGGVLQRAGHTEAAVDLARLAGRAPAGVLCELALDDGTMARTADLAAFAKRHRLPLITIADLIRHRRATEKLVTRIADTRLPTEWGTFRCLAFDSVLDGVTHLALTFGSVAGDAGDPDGDVLVRVHSECLTGDVFASRKCDCGPQLHESMRLIAENGSGVVVYLRGHEGRGIGIGHKLRAYELQERGLDTVDANIELGLPVDNREYGIGAQILADLGVRRMRLMTNNPAKYEGLEGWGLQITERVPILIDVHDDNREYLDTKRDRMGHILPSDDRREPAKGQ